MIAQGLCFDLGGSHAHSTAFDENGRASCNDEIPG
jgi:hypothetical protein